MSEQTFDKLAKHISFFEVMLEDLKAEHARQVAELDVEICELKRQLAGATDSANFKSHLTFDSSRSTSNGTVEHHVHTKELHGGRSRKSTSAGTIGNSALQAAGLPDLDSPKHVGCTQKIQKDSTRHSKWAAHSTVGSQWLRDRRSRFTRYDAKLEKKEKKCCNYHSLREFFDGPEIEALVTLLIVLSTIITALQLQLNGMSQGHKLGVPGYDHAEHAWPGGVNLLDTLDKICNVVFILEFAIRVAYLRMEIMNSWWNLLDFIVVVSSVIDWIMAGSGTSKGLRLLRVIKMARAARALKANKFMVALQLLITSIYASVTTLFWALIVIVSCQCVSAMIMTQAMSAFFDRSDKSDKQLKEVFEYFGTFSRSFVTMFEITLANWAKPCRTLMENAGEEFGVIILTYRCICGFAVLNVVQAVFLQQTMKVMSQDGEIMLLEKHRQEKLYKQRLTRLFEILDFSGDGRATWSELAEVLNTDEVRMECIFLGIDIHDLEDLFHLLDSGDGIVISDFVDAAHQVRKQANNIDMARMLANSRKICFKVTEIWQSLEDLTLLVMRIHRRLAHVEEISPVTTSAAALVISRAPEMCDLDGTGSSPPKLPPWQDEVV